MKVWVVMGNDYPDAPPGMFCRVRRNPLDRRNYEREWARMKYLALGLALLLSTCSGGDLAFAKNWDRDAAQTEEGKIRAEFLSKAGTLPKYKAGQPTGETYHGNCCGEGDAYEADDVFVDETGKLFAVLTCNDPDNCKEVLGHKECGLDEETFEEVCTTVGAKTVRAPGSRWPVPPEVVLKNFDPVNNTGHGWVYIGPNAYEGTNAICWAAPSGY